MKSEMAPHEEKSGIPMEFLLVGMIPEGENGST